MSRVKLQQRIHKSLYERYTAYFTLWQNVYNCLEMLTLFTKNNLKYNLKVDHTKLIFPT